MFIRRNKNRSGSVSIQITRKVNRKNKVVKTVGVAKTKREEELLMLLANTELERLHGMQYLFVEHDDLVVENFVDRHCKRAFTDCRFRIDFGQDL